MRIIVLTKREARMLYDNLTSNPAGYGYIELCRMDARVFKPLEGLMGEYFSRLKELSDEERRARKAIQRKKSPEAMADAKAFLDVLPLEVEDLHDTAEGETVELRVEDSDYDLIRQKLESVEGWSASNEWRHIVMGMMNAVLNAVQQEPTNGKIKKLRDHDHELAPA